MAAIEQAKVSALEERAGVFLVHTATTDAAGEREQTSQYTAGVISRYSVLEEWQRHDGSWQVTIEAEIAPGKDNLVGADRFDVNVRSQVAAVGAEGMQQARMAQAIGDQPVFSIRVDRVWARPYPSFVEVSARVIATWSPKFVDDLRTYAQLAGTFAEPRRDDARGNRLCFAHGPGTSAQCWSLRTQIAAVGRVYLLQGQLAGAVQGGGDLSREVVLESGELRSLTAAGAALFTGGEQAMVLTFAVPLARASQLGEMTFQVVPWKPAVSPGQQRGAMPEQLRQRVAWNGR
jgi:hypothetical protein